MSGKKGISTTLVVIVTAVVVLIVALVLLTIFANVIFGFSSLVEADQWCESQAKLTCPVTGTLPWNWQSPIKVGNDVTTCFDIKNTDVCLPGWK